MCGCGCNTCDTKKPALILNESIAPREILSEGLSYHLDANKPLTEHLYRAGSTKYFDLWAEARSYYSRGIIDITNKDDLAVLTETNLGHFGMFEGKKVPLDFPMELDEGDYDPDQEQEDDEDEIFMPYDDEGRPLGEATYEEGEIAIYMGNDDSGLTHIFKRGSGYYGYNDEFDFEAKDKTELEAKLKRWGYELQAGSLNEAKQDIYDKFLDSPSSPKGRAKAIISKFIKKYGEDATEMAVDRFASQNNLKPEEKYILKYITKNNIKISSQPGGPNLSVLKEAKNDNKPIGKPMRDTSGGKAYKVYVKDPKTGNIKTVRFGSGGLKAKINNPKARKAFAARHKCSTRNDKTKASYWSCRLPRYSSLLGLKSSFSGFW